MANWTEWREAARRRVPKMIFDYVDGGADDEVTLRRNRQAFDDLAFTGRILAGVGVRSQSVTVVGQELAMPVITAPTGLSRASGKAGDLAAASAASALGTVSILSGSSSVSSQEMAASVNDPQWFQIYPYRDQEITRRKLARAQEGGFGALVFTVDAPVSGNRERDKRNGMAIPMQLSPRVALGALARPHWLFDYLAGPPLVSSERPEPRWRRVFPKGDTSLSSVVQGMFHDDQRWENLTQMRRLWDGPLLLKGVMCAEDARMAADAGCDGVIVSNHGGRQLDGLPASVEVLPEVVDAVADRVDVLLDSGVRRGSDVVKALALGAKACLIGRPWVYGLAAGGEAGVRQVLEGFHAEIDRTLALVGVPHATDLDRSILRRRPNSGWVDYEG